MRISTLLRTLGLLLPFLFITRADAALPTPDIPPDGHTTFTSNRRSFTENRGQVIDTKGELRPDIAFTGCHGGATLYFGRDRISYVFTRYERPLLAAKYGDKSIASAERSRSIPPSHVTGHRIDVQIVGANPMARLRGDLRVEGVDNFHLSHHPAGISGARSFRRVLYENIYPKIDLVYYHDGSGLKYDFIVHPGGRPSDIRLRYAGADNVAIGRSGGIRAMHSLGAIDEGAPFTYQGASRRPVASRVVIERDGTIGFAVAAYDSSRALVIDPSVEWGTYLGGEGWDIAVAVAVDRQGNVVVAGDATSAGFPTSPGAFRTTLSGLGDFYVAKFRNNGERLWTTLFGGDSLDRALGMVVDRNDDILVAGATAGGDFPVTQDAMQSTFGGGVQDGFIVKLSTEGERIWSSYFGGGSFDNCTAIAVDSSGAIAVAGVSDGNDLPATPGAFQRTKSMVRDCFVLKLDAGGERMWCSYLGGTSDEQAVGLAVDPGGSLYVTGNTYGNGFPVTQGAFQFTAYDSYEPFVAKIAGNGSAIIWATYFGGDRDDVVSAIGITSDGDIAITGSTTSSLFPVTPGAFQGVYNSQTEGYIAMLDSGGARRWATFYGGSGLDEMKGLAIRGTRIFVTGFTESFDFPVTSGSLPSDEELDAFVVEIDAQGRRIRGSYFGGDGMDQGLAIAVDGAASVILAGETESVTLPIPPGGFQGTNAGGHDAFVAKLGGYSGVDVPSRGGAPHATILTAAPSPARDRVTIAFTLSASDEAAIEIHALDGSTVRRFGARRLEAGEHRVVVDLGGLASGAYIARLRCSQGVSAARFVVIAGER